MLVWPCVVVFAKLLVVPDLLSRPSQAYQVQQESPESLEYSPPEYIAPEATIAALEEVCLNVVSPQDIAKAQEECPDVKNHRRGLMPKGVIMKDIEISGKNSTAKFLMRITLGLYCQSVTGTWF